MGIALTTHVSTTYAHDHLSRPTQAAVLGEATHAPCGQPTPTLHAASETHDRTANRLSGATVGGLATSYTYKANGERASETSVAGTTSYANGESGSLPLLLGGGARKDV